MKTTIGKKISFAFFVILVLMGIMVFITFQNFNKIIHSLDAIESQAVKRGATGNFRFSITQLLMPVHDYIITGATAEKMKYDEWKEKVFVYRNILLSQDLSDSEKSLIKSININLDSIFIYSERIFSISGVNQSAEAKILMKKMDIDFGDEINIKTTLLFDIISSNIEKERLSAIENKEAALQGIYLILIAAFLTSVLVTFLTINRIAKPIISLQKAASALAKGDYNVLPEVKTHDEIAELSETFINMAGEIKKSTSLLEESNRFKESIVETVPLGILVFNEGGDVISYNRRFFEMFRFNSNEISEDKKICDVLKKAGISEDCRKEICKRTPMTDVECKFLKKWGGEQILQLSLAGIQSSSNQYLIVFEDITEKKKNEKFIKKLSLAVQQTDDAIFITDINGNIEYVNPSFERQTGYTREEALGKKPNILKSGVKDKKHYKQLWDTILSGKVFNDICINKKKNGDIFYVQQTISPIFNEQGEITHFVSTNKDITQNLIAEQNLKKSELKYRLLHEQSLDSIYLYDYKNHKILEANESFINLLGYSREELETLTIFDFVAHEKNEIESVANEILTKGRFIIGERKWKKKDGIIIDVDVLGSSIKIDDEQIFFITARDISERKKQEEIVRESERFATNTIDSIGSQIAILDESGVIIHANRAWREFLKKNRNLFIGLSTGINYLQHCKTLDDESTKEAGEIAKCISTVMNNERDICNHEFECTFCDGIKWLSCRVTRFTGEGPLRVVIAFHDITERKKAELEIKQSLREKETLLKEIHHRVKNNLQIISSLIKLQGAKYKETDVYQSFMQSLNRVRSMALVHEKLYHSPRLSSINFKPYIEKLVYNLFEIYSVLSSRIIININVEDVSLNIETAIPLGLIINELVSNSLKHAFPEDSKGSIRIVLKPEGGNTFFLQIEDNGKGIPEHIDITKTDSLGMQLIHSLVEQLDGKLNIISSNSGTDIKIVFNEIKYKERI